MQEKNKLIGGLHRRFLKLTTPIWGTVPASGYWVSGREYYQHYQGQLPELDYYVCEQAHSVDYQLPRSIYTEISPGFSQQTQRRIPEAYWLTVPKSMILRAHRSMGSVIAHDAKVIHDSSRQFWVQLEKNEALYRKFPINQTVNNSIAVTTDGGGGLNYWHWLVDILPRIYLLKYGDIWSKIDYFLIDKPPSKMLITLEILGVKQNQIIYTKYGQSLRTPLTIVPQFIQEKPYWIVRFLREYFLSHGSRFLGTSTKVYISRRKAKRRRILNEELVLDYLTQRGYVAWDLEDLSFPEQITLFRQAKYVIGLHGAGLTNIIWCEAGTRVLEIFPNALVRDCYWVLANHRELDYCYWYPEDEVTNETSNFIHDIVIDVKQFAEVLEHFES